MIQFVGRDAYKQFWNFSKDEKENLATQLAIELPALRGKVGASQEEMVVSRVFRKLVCRLCCE